LHSDIQQLDDRRGGGGGSSVKESVTAEWNELCRPSSVLRDVGDSGDNDNGNRVKPRASYLN
jgi:hypothetical protein